MFCLQTTIIYTCFLIVYKLVFLSRFFVCVFYQLTTFAVLILYYIFYFVKRGINEKAGKK